MLVSCEIIYVQKTYQIVASQKLEAKQRPINLWMDKQTVIHP